MAAPGLHIRKRAHDRSAPPPRDLKGIELTEPTAPHRPLDAASAPDQARVSDNLIAEGIREGWITGHGLDVVLRPAGPPDNPMGGSVADGRNHEFHHYDKITFHTLHGDITYKVTHQPDKYAADGDDKTKVTDKVYASGNTRVDHFYDLTKEK